MVLKNYKIMIYLIKKILFLLVIGFALSQGSFNSTIHEKKKLAQIYTESSLYDDAIIIYEEILEVEKEIFGENNINLLETISNLSKLSQLNNDIEKTKAYIQEYINIQSIFILKQQNQYIKPLKDLKNIYINEKKPNIVFALDSLLQIISNNTHTIQQDSSLILPQLLINRIDSTNSETAYSNNDMALELIDNGLNYLNNNLYTEAKINFINALNLNADILDLDYWDNIDFGKEKDNLYSSLLEDLDNDSTKTDNNFYLGLIKYQEEDYSNAIKYFNKYNQNNTNTLLFLGKINVLTLNLFDAMFYYYRCLKKEPENLYANKALADILIELQDYKEAIHILKYIAKGTNDHSILYNLGLSYYQINNYKESIKYLTQALLLNPEDFKNYYYLGLAYKSDKLYKQSLDAFKKCISLNSNWGLAHYELGLIYGITLNDDLAIKHFELAKRNETFDDLNYKLGMLYYKNQNFIKAMKPLKEYLLQHMKDYDTMKIMGEIFLSTNRYPEAIDIYYRLIDIEPNNEKYYYNIANSYYNLNDFNNALDYYLKVINLNEENYSVFIDIGTIFNKKNQFNQAEKYLLKALDCGSTNKNLLIQLGIAYGGQKKFLESLIVFKEALKFSLEDPILHYQIGIIYKELEIFDLAINNFSFYLKTNPKDEITLLLIGECYLNLKNYEKAIQFFERTYKLNNNNNSALFNIAVAYEMEGDLKNAAKFFKNVIKKNPDHVQSRKKLIIIYKELNKFREAKKECEIIYMLDRSIYNSIKFCNQ